MTPNTSPLSEDELVALRDSPDVASVQESRDGDTGIYTAIITFTDGRVATYTANV